jgi:predicted RNA binding protein YcfA (HicA-like mRNA interferase family)
LVRTGELDFLKARSLPGKGLGFEEVSGTGSRVKFHDPESGRIMNLHRPHPGNIVKQYVLDRVIDELKDRGIRP